LLQGWGFSGSSSSSLLCWLSSGSCFGGGSKSALVSIDRGRSRTCPRCRYARARSPTGPSRSMEWLSRQGDLIRLAGRPTSAPAQGGDRAQHSVMESVRSLLLGE
jgi:hypothetical protein